MASASPSGEIGGAGASGLCFLMQWVFLALALWAALVELHTGTFYLAALAAVAFVTFVLGFWVREELLLFLFVAGCILAPTMVWLWRRYRPRDQGLPDLDIGQEVTIAAVRPHDKRCVVTYRGTRWDAVMEDGSAPPAPGTDAYVVRKTGSLLHLAVRTGTATTADGTEDHGTAAH